MDTLMLVVTAASVVIATAASVIAWRVTRIERARRAARVTALAAAAGVATTPQPAPWPAVTADTAARSADGLDDFNPAQARATAVDADRQHAGASATATPAIFGATVGDSGSGHRQHGLLAAAAVVAVLVGGGAALLVVSGRGPAASSAATRVPLELVALSHARSNGQLAVMGIVRNPAAGAVVDGVEAHVRVFDAAGILVATRSGPVDVAALPPGQDAPFSIPLGEAQTAARYRVSFASRGTMLAHVDRRTNLPAAVTADAR